MASTTIKSMQQLMHQLTTKPSPVQTGQHNFIVNNVRYRVLKFAEGTGPTQEEAIEIAKNHPGYRMLTFAEFNEIIENAELSKTFINVLFINTLQDPKRVWAHASDPKPTGTSLAPCLRYHKGDRKLSANYWPDHGYVPIMILKETNSEAAVQIAAEHAVRE